MKKLRKIVKYNYELPVTLWSQLVYVFAIFYSLGAWNINAIYISFGVAILTVIFIMIVELFVNREVYYEEIHLNDKGGK